MPGHSIEDRGHYIVIDWFYVNYIEVLEDQPKKITDIVNNYFVKNPVVFTLLLSGCISVLIFIAGSDYTKPDKELQLTEGSVSGSGTKEDAAGQGIKVDLSGAIKNPGVYAVNDGARLGDVINLGGGFTNETSSQWVSKNLNLSQSVSDGQKIYVPFEWDLDRLGDNYDVKALSLGVVSASEQAFLITEQMKKMDVENPGQSSTSSLPTTEISGKVNVNSASLAQLDDLQGVGPAYAGRIIENRPYLNFEEFKNNSKLPVSLTDALKDLIAY